MKNRFLLSAILSGALLTSMYASTDSGYQATLSASRATRPELTMTVVTLPTHRYSRP